MSEGRDRRASGKRYGALTAAGVYALFTVVGLLEGTQGWIGTRTGHLIFRPYAYPGESVAWLDITIRQTVSWWVFATFVLATLALALRFPIRRGRLPRTALFHLAVSLLFPVLFLGAAAGVRYVVFLRDISAVTYGTLLGRSLAVYYSLSMLYYWAIIGVASAFLYYRLYRERALAEARLQRDLSDAQLRTLQAQLQPHFLFNTLNAVCGYALERNHEAVVAMLTRLSDLLRAILRSRATHTVALEEELRTLNAYLDLQRLRLGERLSVSVAVQPEALNAAVPPLLLQPIVENAIQHGIAQRPDGGRVEVSATRSNGTIELAVADDGPGFDARAFGAAGHGLGLAATVERLRLVYGDACAVHACTRHGGGALLRIVLPYRPADGATAAEES